MKSNGIKTKLIFFIKDDSGVVWGVAPSTIQARRQIMWFLPKGQTYYIDFCVIDNDQNSI